LAADDDRQRFTGDKKTGFSVSQVRFTHLHTGVFKPDGLFSNQKSKFGKICSDPDRKMLIYFMAI
jgi:hypothetical protein